MNFKIVKLFLTALLMFLFLGCEDKSSSKNNPIVQKTNKPYENQSIMIIVPKLHANLVRGPILKEVKSFEEQTGATVNVVTPSWGETIRSINDSLNNKSGLTYDIYVVIGLWNGTLLADQNRIAPIPNWVKDKIKWDDVLPIYKNNVLKWDNIDYGLPYDGDTITMYYRKDIFEDKKIQDKYFKTYNTKLDIPKTWNEYIQISKFFTNWDWDSDGKIEYGNAGLRIKGDVSLLQFFAFAGAYTKLPDQKSYYFDIDTMKPTINNEGFIKALEQYIELIKYGPKGMKNFAGHDVRNAFVNGEVVLAIDWADLGTYAANSPISIVKDKIGYAKLPGSNEVFNNKNRSWENRYNNTSSISGNWMFFVNKNSTNQKLAFEFASHMTSQETTKKYIVDAGSGINPSRYSHFKDEQSWEKAGFSKESARLYLDTLKDSLNNENALVDIMIPGGELYYQALDELVYEAVLGKITPKEALDKAVTKWEKITDDLDREKQKAYYKASLNLN